jgi:predicted DCC family thiol-disulfide oxidoreductase YuxK
MTQQQDINNSLKPVVFYDGSCPMCSREIRHYQRLRGADKLLWIDIAEDNTSLMAYGLDKDVAMARFHVMDKSGAWQTGAFGFAELWFHLPAYRWLAVLFRKLRLLPLLDKAYTRFASWRLRRSCKDGSCDIKP